MQTLRWSTLKKLTIEYLVTVQGNYRKEHVFALEQSYEAYEFFHKQICKCEKAIEIILPTLQIKELLQDENKVEPIDTKRRAKKKSYNRSPYSFNAPIEIKKITVADLTTIPGIDSNTAMKLLSEIGTDMTRWPTVKAFASWLGLCPGNKISGGKILSSKTKPSDNRAAQALRMAASALYRSKTALGAFFRRLRARLGGPKAITATAHKLARILYRMLTERVNYKEVGENYYEQQYQAKVLASLEKRAKELGYKLVPTN
jgi:transposase